MASRPCSLHVSLGPSLHPAVLGLRRNSLLKLMHQAMIHTLAAQLRVFPREESPMSESTVTEPQAGTPALKRVGAALGGKAPARAPGAAISRPR